MKPQFTATVILCLFILLSACNQSTETQKEESKSNTTSTGQTASSNFESPLPKVKELLSSCVKVEYLLYDLGISFETESNEEVMRFYSYIMNQPANVTNCKQGKYDGSVVFKDTNGDIKLGMEFNILNGCNRVSFPMDGKNYELPINEAGLGFFNQILNMRSKAETDNG